MPDVHACLFEYREYPIYMRLNLGTEMEEVVRFQGSKGVLEMKEFGLSFEPQTGKDLRPSYYALGFPRDMRAAYVKQWREENEAKLKQEPKLETVSSKEHDYDDMKPHMAGFFDAVRSRKPVAQDAVFGHHAALACHMANESYFRQSPVTWDAASKEIKS